jgi:amino acid permease
MSTLKNNFGGNLFSNQSIYPRLHHQKRPPRQSSPYLLWHRSAKQQGLPLAKNNKSREKKCPGVFPLMIFKCILSHLFNMFCIFFSKRHVQNAFFHNTFSTCFFFTCFFPHVCETCENIWKNAL